MKTRILSAVGGLILGLLVWLGLAEAYGGLLARVNEPLLRMTEGRKVSRLVARPDGIVVERTDFPRSSARPVVPVSDLTFNVILLMALFGWSRAPLATRNVTRLCIALFLLTLTHVAGVFVTVKAIYALKLGNWSQAHYSSFARNVWGVLEHFYRLVGMYAFAFVLWWGLGTPMDWADSSKSLRQRVSKT